MGRKKGKPIEKKRTNSPMMLNVTAKEFLQLTAKGYTRLIDVPEVQTAINHVADQISVMTIKLMENTENGNKRIRNELSRKIDINPCKHITRQAWIKKIVKDMLVNGNSFHLPFFSSGILDYIKPLENTRCSISSINDDYKIYYNGIAFEPDEILHFAYNIDEDKPYLGLGLRCSLNAVSKTLIQARTTQKALMESPVPSLIVKVDGLSEDFSSRTGREKLLEQYITSSESGKPWMIPSENFAVEAVKPLSLTDLAIVDSIKLDKRTAASIIGVPPFIVGEGSFNADEYNNFVQTKLLPIVTTIEQEMTRKLIVSPKWFFAFNPRSLYSYSLTELAEVSCNLVDRAIIDRNEARNWIGCDPREGLSELAILENYIPYSKIGDQNKLKGGTSDGKTD